MILMYSADSGVSSRTRIPDSVRLNFLNLLSLRAPGLTLSPLEPLRMKRGVAYEPKGTVQAFVDVLILP